MDLTEYVRTFAGLMSPSGKRPGYKYASTYELVAAEGRGFVSAGLTVDQHAYVRSVIRGRGRFPWKQCFSSSQLVKLNDRENRLEYYEGYAVCATGIPVHHGWLVLDGDRVIDLTWRKHGLARVRRKLEHTRIFGEFPTGWGYFGMNVASGSDIRRYAVTYGEWASFLDNWREGFPLMRESSNQAHDGGAP